SVALLDRIDRVAAELGLRPQVLFHVNLTDEESKPGAAAEELPALAARAARASAVEAVGLMTMGPLSSDPEDSRPCCRRLREMRDDLRQNGLVTETFHHLSMGMTDDFEIAVEEGATLVRVGRALYRGLEEPQTGV
ncbi:MAG: alanine racemase, partial [Planctomycetes bacterium]|nr:alanine racemase [Planctomycetota bacterium]